MSVSSVASAPAKSSSRNALQSLAELLSAQKSDRDRRSEGGSFKSEVSIVSIADSRSDAARGASSHPKDGEVHGNFGASRGGRRRASGGSRPPSVAGSVATLPAPSTPQHPATAAADNEIERRRSKSWNAKRKSSVKSFSGHMALYSSGGSALSSGGRHRSFKGVIGRGGRLHRSGGSLSGGLVIAQAALRRGDVAVGSRCRRGDRPTAGALIGRHSQEGAEHRVRSLHHLHQPAHMV